MEKSDVLSDVFATLRLQSDIYFRADLSGPFAVAIPADRHLIRFHFVRYGTCLVRAGGSGEWVGLSEGDLALVPNGKGHVIADAPDRTPAPLGDVIGSGALDASGMLTYGAGEGRVRLLCGFCSFDEAIDHPVIANLPSAIVLRTKDIGHEPWLLAALRLLSLETELDAQGMNGVLSRLLEILFIQTLRREAAMNDGDAPGYIRALSDPQLSKALLAMHRQPERSWTIAELARLSAMSRARFADRFTEMVGVPPIGYLTIWRLMKARLLLRETDLAIDEIALRCGYASLPSFSRRYKAAFGIGPGAYRRAEKVR